MRNGLILLFLFTFATSIQSQLIREKYRDVIVTNENDTVFIDRTPSEWWFGPFISGSPFSSIYFGKLNVPAYKIPEIDDFQNIITYKGGSGWSYDVGLYSQWKRLDKDWGASIRISMYDFRNSETSTTINDTVRTTYKNNTDLVYITFSPSATYNFKKYPSLNAFAGLDFEIPLSARANQMKTFYNPDYIENVYNYQYQKQNFRLGIHAGFSYDLFSANIKAFARSQISLFMLMSSGTSQIADFGSNFNSFVIKGGIIIKISPDKLEIDTHRYNPNYVEPPIALASAVATNGVSFPGFKSEQFESADLAYIELPKIVTIVPPEPEKPVEVAQVKVEQPKKQYNFNVKKIINFPKSATDYDLKNEDKEYLDALATYLLANPSTKVFVEGYNDDQGGSLIENQKRSVERANNVKRYLMNKKIPEGRIISLGRGSVNPLVPNISKANRAKNRRVEITIQR